MLDSENCKPGQEQYEKFFTRLTGRGRRAMFQYDYRDDDGELFSTIKPSLADCRAKRDLWKFEKSKGAEPI